MLTIYIITPFPDIIKPILSSSILNKAKEKYLVNYQIINLFDYVENSVDRIDDYPFGGADGMLLKAFPIHKAISSIDTKISRIIYPTPDGETFSHKKSFNLSQEKTLVFICGHYKGIDQRIRDKFITDEISIGDFVMTCGELPALMMVDSIVRLIPGVLSSYESATSDSFFDDLLDGPHYTRPRTFENIEVPKVLLSGNHKEIKEWFLKQRIKMKI